MRGSGSERGALAALVLLGTAGCAEVSPPRLDQAARVVEGVEGPWRLRELAAAFYGSLIDRRVNSLDTYRDPSLRDFFASREAFSDYYANLAEALDRAYFEDNRPIAAWVEQIDAGEADQAQLLVRFRGDNRLPLRWWPVDLVREDRWERSGEKWWIVPGKL